MKTKVKLVLLGVVCISFFGPVSDIHATWYGSHLYGYANTGWRECNDDGDITGGVGDVAQGKDHRVTGWGGAAAGNMTCEYWDGANPTASANNVTGTWKNANINITLAASDAGGSTLTSARYAWDAPCAAGTAYANGAGITLSTEGTHVLNLCVSDGAGNTGNWSGTYYLDKTAPSVATDITNANPANLLANNAYSYSISIGVAGGSPIASITANSENYTFPPLTTTPRTSASNVLTFAWNIQNVDSDRQPTGGRPYTFTVTQICDTAGNCSVGSRVYTHDVYANPNSLNASSNTLVGFGATIADGIGNNFVQTIRDSYGNAIIPATGIGRTVSMDLSSVTNTMHLNQHNRSGGSSVFLQPPSSGVDIALTTGASQAFGNQPSTNGSYPLIIKAFTPTANGYPALAPVSDSLAGFGFSSDLHVTDITFGVNVTLSQTLANPIFRPLFTTAITGNLRSGGFIEGTEQESQIGITTNNPNGVAPSSIEMQLAFGGTNATSFDMYGGGAGNSGTTITATRAAMTPNPGTTGPINIFTKLVEKTVVGAGSNIQLSTHYSYTLGGHNIVYNSDLIGKDGGYWGTVVTGIGAQVGVKIIGPIASNVVQSIVTGQFSAGTSIFGGISRADARNNIKKSIALATRNMIFSGRSGTVSSLTVLPTAGSAYSGSYIDKGGNSSIMKLQQAGGTITMSLGAIAGKRTLVIKGADLYINTNMYYQTGTPNSILGVVVQKDEAGNGGNLYIHPSVTNIVGTYIIDGSVMSSNNGTTPIGTSNITVLRNQLYIYGSIVSENTIGGSRMIPYKCPSLISAALCTSLADAQRYDLNYLRRYYIFNGLPFGSLSVFTKVIGGAVFNTPTTTSTAFDPNLIKKFTATTDDLAKYPVIIEYNPNIRSNPPIGFESSKD